MASRAYRGVIFHPGEIVTKGDSQEYFMILGHCAHLMIMLWKVVVMELVDNANKAFAVGTGLNMNDSAIWASPLELDDFHAVPTNIVSPLHLCVSNHKQVHKHNGVVLLQCGQTISMMEHAARNCYWGMQLPQLKRFCKESDLHPTTPDLLGHLEIMISTTLPGISLAELHEILKLRCKKKDDPLLEIDDSIIEAMFPAQDVKVIEDTSKCQYFISRFVYGIHITN